MYARWRTSPAPFNPPQYHIFPLDEWLIRKELEQFRKGISAFRHLREHASIVRTDVARRTEEALPRIDATGRSPPTSKLYPCERERFRLADVPPVPPKVRSAPGSTPLKAQTRANEAFAVIVAVVEAVAMAAVIAMEIANGSVTGSAVRKPRDVSILLGAAKGYNTSDVMDTR